VTAGAPRVELRGVAKRFGGVAALRGVDLDVGPGEIVGLVGENGSGKSTLMRVLAGDVVPDAGQVTVDGTALPHGDLRSRLEAGVGVVFQESNVCPELDVAENLFLGDLAATAGMIRWSRVRAEAGQVLGRAGIPLRPGARVRGLSRTTGTSPTWPGCWPAGSECWSWTRRPPR
jgi:ribose transport system ATP-binding protein